MRFYFTYASEECGMPFIGGWTEVEAENADDAVSKFKAAHPTPGNDDVINCCSLYDEELFKRTLMLEKGNFGKFCQEVL